MNPFPDHDESNISMHSLGIPITKSMEQPSQLLLLCPWKKERWALVHWWRLSISDSASFQICLQFINCGFSVCAKRIDLLDWIHLVSIPSSVFPTTILAPWCCAFSSSKCWSVTGLYQAALEPAICKGWACLSINSEGKSCIEERSRYQYQVHKKLCITTKKPEDKLMNSFSPCRPIQTLWFGFLHAETLKHLQ